MRIESKTLKLNADIWGGQKTFDFPKGTAKVRIYSDHDNSWKIRCYDSRGEKLSTIYLDEIE